MERTVISKWILFLQLAACVSSVSGDCKSYRPCKPVEEFCDENQGRCNLCSRLCFPGQDNALSCEHYCAEYKRLVLDKTTTHATALENTTEAKPSALKLRSNQGKEGVAPLVIVAISMVGVVAIGFSLYLCRKRLLRCRSPRQDEEDPSQQTLAPFQEQDAGASGALHTGMRNENLTNRLS